MLLRAMYTLCTTSRVASPRPPWPGLFTRANAERGACRGIDRGAGALVRNALEALHGADGLAAFGDEHGAGGEQVGVGAVRLDARPTGAWKGHAGLRMAWLGTRFLASNGGHKADIQVASLTWVVACTRSCLLPLWACTQFSRLIGAVASAHLSLANMRPVSSAVSSMLEPHHSFATPCRKHSWQQTLTLVASTCRLAFTGKLQSCTAAAFARPDQT